MNQGRYGTSAQLERSLWANRRANKVLFPFTDLFRRFSHAFPNQESLIQVLPREGETWGILIAWKNLLKTSKLRASACAYKIFLKGRCMHGTTTSDYMHFHLLQNYPCMQKREATCKRERTTIVSIKIDISFRKWFWHETWDSKLKYKDKTWNHDTSSA